MMIYPKSKGKFNEEEFKSPSCEYRAVPFWAWNCVLDKDKLMRQMEYLKLMGFGGVHIHSRSGMATEYLGKDFMEYVSACLNKAKKDDMKIYLYDEDRYPSGSAGGLVTKDVEYRRRYAVFTKEVYDDTVDLAHSRKSDKPVHLASYDVELNSDGSLKDYKRTEIKDGTWNFYLVVGECDGWFNGYTYIDSMYKKAVDRFIEVTYEAYKNNFGNDFGGTIPTIFTDEPNTYVKQCFEDAFDTKERYLSWTCDLTETFFNEYQKDILDYVPELFWNKSDGVSEVRYLYHRHCNDRFAEAFMYNIGKWCEKNNIGFTGHVLWEPFLYSQTEHIGEAMRLYKHMAVPGIDMLVNAVEINTAKQAQSVAHQYGKSGVMSELYGVTGWDFDFAGHKYQGDWQAALGITLRVPHLSWVSMKGSAKRDYPASINYQSPWYEKYSLIENHFARLNTVLTRGNAKVNVAVIHPIESYWLSYGPTSQCGTKKDELENNFANLSRWLITNQIDFDYISEALIDELFDRSSGKFGCMEYQTILIPPVVTLRKETLDVLEKFVSLGARVVALSDAPKYVNAVESTEARDVYNKFERISFEEEKIISSLEKERIVEVKNENSVRNKDYICCVREDEDSNWVFVCHIEKKYLEYSDKKEKIHIEIKGEYLPTLYDTINGTYRICDYEYLDGKTIIHCNLCSEDSVLLRLQEPTKEKEKTLIDGRAEIKTEVLNQKTNIVLSEPNVCVLDRARYAINAERYNDSEEICRIDTKVREVLDYIPASGTNIQPWACRVDDPKDFVNLEFTIYSEFDIDNAYLAYEEAEKICLNGQIISKNICGYYIDEDIHKIKLGKINKGSNILQVVCPVSDRISVENMFLLGNFDVCVEGEKITLKQPQREHGCGSLTHKGLAFYGGNISYEYDINVPICKSFDVSANAFMNCVIGVSVDDGEEKVIALAPHTVTFKGINEGTHKIRLTVYGNRHNTCSALHITKDMKWKGPSMWYTKDDDWSYNYYLKDLGLTNAPIVIFYK